jgi:hypothetical protein
VIDLKLSQDDVKVELSELEEQNRIKLADTPLVSRFLCWTCGLYMNEQEICFNCVKFNPWTFDKIENNGINKR